MCGFFTDGQIHRPDQILIQMDSSLESKTVNFSVWLFFLLCFVKWHTIIFHWNKYLPICRLFSFTEGWILLYVTIPWYNRQFKLFPNQGPEQGDDHFFLWMTCSRQTACIDVGRQKQIKVISPCSYHCPTSLCGSISKNLLILSIDKYKMLNGLEFISSIICLKTKF